MRLGLITLVAAGCSFHASYDGTHYQCGAGDSCPSGQSCVAGECVEASGAPDAPLGTPDAAPGTPDAGTPVSACGALTALRDDFSTDRAGTYWDPWSDGGPVSQVTGGHLSITIPTNGADNGAGYGSYFYYDFTDSEARITVTAVADVDTILEVRDDNGAKAQMLVDKGTLHAGVFGNVTGGGDRAMIAYDPAQQKQWRLREAAGVTYWEWSPDGAAWTELWHENDPIAPEHVIVELAADGNGPSEARFDDLNVATPDPGLCDASTITDDFTATAFAPMWAAWSDGGGAAIAETGGGVVITNNAAADKWAGFQTRHLYDLHADSYYVDASTVPQQTPFVSWAQAMAPGGGGEVLETNVEGTSIQFVQKVAGNATDSKSLTYDPVAHRFWRFRGAGGTVYWDTSPDGATWTMRLSAPDRIGAGAVMFVMGGGEYSGGATPSSQTERFGSVNVP